MILPARRDPGVRRHTWKALRDEPWQVLSAWRAQGGKEWLNPLSCRVAVREATPGVQMTVTSTHDNKPLAMRELKLCTVTATYLMSSNKINTQLCATMATVTPAATILRLKSPCVKLLAGQTSFLVLRQIALNPLGHHSFQIVQFLNFGVLFFCPNEILA